MQPNQPRTADKLESIEIVKFISFQECQISYFLNLSNGKQIWSCYSFDFSKRPVKKKNDQEIEK